MPTKQETFDTVYKHLVTQGRPSIKEDQCLYRGPKNRTCAVGCLIPDELYDPKMEACGINNLIERGFDLPNYFTKQKTLLERLQAVHDEPGFWTLRGLSKLGHEAMEEVAKDFRLKYNKPIKKA